MDLTLLALGHRLREALNKLVAKKAQGFLFPGYLLHGRGGSGGTVKKMVVETDSNLFVLVPYLGQQNNLPSLFQRKVQQIEFKIYSIQKIERSTIKLKYILI